MTPESPTQEPQGSVQFVISHLLSVFQCWGLLTLPASRNLKNSSLL